MTTVVYAVDQAWRTCSRYQITTETKQADCHPQSNKIPHEQTIPYPGQTRAFKNTSSNYHPLVLHRICFFNVPVVTKLQKLLAEFLIRRLIMTNKQEAQQSLGWGPRTGYHWCYRSSKVDDFCVMSKGVCHFLLVIFRRSLAPFSHSTSVTNERTDDRQTVDNDDKGPTLAQRSDQKQTKRDGAWSRNGI